MVNSMSAANVRPVLLEHLVLPEPLRAQIALRIKFLLRVLVLARPALMDKVLLR